MKATYQLSVTRLLPDGTWEEVNVLVFSGPTELTQEQEDGVHEAIHSLADFVQGIETMSPLAQTLQASIAATVGSHDEESE